MLYKSLKILFPLCLVFHLSGFSQINIPKESQDLLIDGFNDYLKSIKLDSYITATGFQHQEKLDYSGKIGKTKLNSINVLILRPNPKYQDVLEFAGIWKKIIQANKKNGNLYEKLFLRLINYSNNEPEKLSILFETDKPEVFSFLIYFDKQIKVNNSVTDIKGSSVIPVETLKNFSFEGYIKDAKLTPEIRKKLIESIEIFLKTSKVKDPEPKVDVKNKYDSYYTFMGTNLKGKITKDYYDMIILYMSLIPVESKRNTVDIAYNFSVKYGSSPYSVAQGKNNYEDGAKRYAIQMAKFNEDLRDLIQTITDARIKK